MMPIDIMRAIEAGIIGKLHEMDFSIDSVKIQEGYDEDFATLDDDLGMDYEYRWSGEFVTWCKGKHTFGTFTAICTIQNDDTDPQPDDITLLDIEFEDSCIQIWG
jgi:hypothetical protein